MSANFQRPVSETRVVLEIDGVQAIVAIETTPSGFKHTPVKYQPLNQRRPENLPGNYEVEEYSFKHARALGQVGQQLVAWLIGVASGDFVERRTLRHITMDETGRTPVETWELTDCLPTMYKPETSGGAGTGVASFSFSVQPTEARLI